MGRKQYFISVPVCLLSIILNANLASAQDSETLYFTANDDSYQSFSIQANLGGTSESWIHWPGASTVYCDHNPGCDREGKIYLTTSAGTSYTVYVKQKGSSPGSFIYGPESVCVGDTKEFYVSAAQGLNYSWNTLNCTIVSGRSTPKVVILFTGNVATIDIDINGSCPTVKGTRSVSVNPYPTPVITTSRTLVDCANKTATLSASGGNIFHWSTGETSTTINVSPLVKTTYTVTAANGLCYTLKDQIIDVNKPLPLAVITTSNLTVTCSMPSATLSVPDAVGNTYLWSTGGTAKAITVSPALTTTYSVKVTNALGCSVNSVQEIISNKVFTSFNNIDSSPASQSLTEGKSAKLSVVLQGENLTYEWQLSPNSSGTYTSLAGSNSSVYITPMLTLSNNNDLYRCKVMGACNTAVSNPAKLTVMTNPNITTTAYSPPVFSSANNNYIYASTPQVALQQLAFEKAVAGDITTITNNHLKLGDISHQTQYFDGLGRPIQSVAYRNSAVGQDEVSVQTYDQYGRQINNYLPFSSGYTGTYKPSAVMPQSSFYQGPDENIARDDRPYTEIIFESSPLNRPLKQYGAGANWSATSANKFILHQYLTNSHLSENIISWGINAAVLPERSPAIAKITEVGGYYSSGQLYIKSTKDEQGKEIREYTDKEGKVILKKVQAAEVAELNDRNDWALTYYIYDDFGNLRFVLQPELSKLIHQNDIYNPSANDLSNYAFQYKYDYRNRMTEKRVPGADAVYMVYDVRDRLRLTQDANQRKSNQWTYTKFDALNRPVITGIYTHASSVDQVTMTGLLTSVLSEQYNGSSLNHGYTNLMFPTTGTEILSISYYDDYSFKSLFNSAAFNFRKNELPLVNGLPAQVSNEFLSVRGLATGSKIKSLSTNTWLRSVNYYDDHYRPVQQIAENLKGHTLTTSVFDFAGKILRTKSSLFLGQPVIWTKLIGAQVQGDALMSTGSGIWAEGASSSQTLAAGSDGWIEVTVVNSLPAFAFGLSVSDINTNVNTVDYAWNVNETNLRVNEKGVAKGSGVNAFPGDVLRVERIDGIIYYKRNGMIIYTSATASAGLLIADVSFYNTGSSLSKARLSNTFSSLSPLVASSYITKRFDYDHAGRLINTWHQVNGSTEILLSKNAYNELGQLVDKKLHSTVVSGADAKQSVDYRYNIRGWLTSINNAALSNDGQSNDDTGDYFGMNLNYEKPDANLGSTGLFNGNISAMKWSSNQGFGDVKETGYNFTYDALNRLTAANSRMNNKNSWQVGYFDEIIPLYDLNGNIKKLQRKGDNGALIDDLTYNYGAAASMSNKLLSVSDAVTNTTDKAKGFADGNPGTGDFTYDTNGNMITDKNKAITVPIAYNHLNLPTTILRSYSTIYYNYDAAGTKLSQLTSFGTNQKLTEYIGPWVFENNELQFIQHEEGRIVLSGKKTFYTSSADAATDFIATAKATLTSATINGEKYTQVNPAAGVSMSKAGISRMGNVYPVLAGERYIFKVKGFSNGTSIANLYVKGDTDDILWPGAPLPKQDVNESWVESAFTIPAGVTQIVIGVMFNSSNPATTANNFFVNEVELYKQTTVTPEYQYHLKDHLGNVRLTFTTNQETEVATATMETTNRAGESGKFLRYDRVRIVNSSPVFDHTNAAANGSSIRLSGNANEKTGLVRSLAVMPGDVIQTEVYGKYLDQNKSNWTAALTSLVAAITTGNAATVVDGASYPTNPSNPFPYTGLNNTGSSTGLGPKAYLNYLVFDKDFNPILAQCGYKRLSNVPKEKGQDVAHEKLEAQITIQHAGYVYIYLSNEETSPVEVYFDDFQVTQIKSPVIAAQDYYPFGLTFNSYQRENSVENRYLYNQGTGAKTFKTERIFDLGLNVDMTKYRVYDPALGRWWQIDPKADEGDLVEWTPYNYSNNDPIRYNDPEGDCPWCIGAIIGAATDYAAQVSVNLIQGQELGDALTNVNGASIVASAAMGALTAGASALTTTIGAQAGKQIVTQAAKTTTQQVVKQATKVVTTTAVKIKNTLDQRTQQLNKTDRSGKDFTKAGKQVVKEQNATKNAGQTKCENCGTNTQPGQKHEKGVTPPGNETHVDHVDPKANGGSGTPNNGQVLCRDCNLQKGAN